MLRKYNPSCCYNFICFTHSMEMAVSAGAQLFRTTTVYLLKWSSGGPPISYLLGFEETSSRITWGIVLAKKKPLNTQAFPESRNIETRTGNLISRELSEAISFFPRKAILIPSVRGDGSRCFSRENRQSKVDSPIASELTRHEISIPQLEEYLRKNVPEIALPLHVDQFTYGQVLYVGQFQSVNTSPIQRTFSMIQRGRNMCCGRNHRARCSVKRHMPSNENIKSSPHCPRPRFLHPKSIVFVRIVKSLGHPFTYNHKRPA